jgi:lipopolysaccharide export system protein LptC
VSRLVLPSLLGLSLSGLSLLGLLAPACTPRRPAPDAASEPRPDVVLEGARLRTYEGDRLLLSGTARQVRFRRAGGEVQASDVTVRLPPGQGSQGSPVPLEKGATITAPNMDGTLASRQWVGTGGVVVRTGDGMVARTPTLTYDAAEQRAHGEEGVTVQGPDYRMRADRFTLSAADETFTFDGAVETVLGGATE